MTNGQRLIDIWERFKPSVGEGIRGGVLQDGPRTVYAPVWKAANGDFIVIVDPNMIFTRPFVILDYLVRSSLVKLLESMNVVHVGIVDLQAEIHDKRIGLDVEITGSVILPDNTRMPAFKIGSISTRGGWRPSVNVDPDCVSEEIN